MFRYFFLAIIFTCVLKAETALRLPTENHHLFTGEPELFYMYVDRTFEGKTSQPWEGGTFGYVRNAMRMGDQVIYTKFHEGIDITPVHRDRSGNPLDLVASIADGMVVHASLISGKSNYGKYVVVQHTWQNSEFYSLYAHLSEITCKPGDSVQAGSVIGRMGFTGVGINRARAHLHLELTLLINRNYDEWHKTHVSGINQHGVFNGMNLIGVDIARFLTDQKANPELRISDFISSTPVYFKVTVPAKDTMDFVTRYPWICRGNPSGAVSWEISFSATGLPIAFAPSQVPVDVPLVTSLVPSFIPHPYFAFIGDAHHSATLTASGKQLVALLTNDFPIRTVSKQASSSPKS